jgi:hypothetical protein
LFERFLGSLSAKEPAIMQGNVREISDYITLYKLPRVSAMAWLSLGGDYNRYEAVQLLSSGLSETS